MTGKTFEESVTPELLERWIECCDLVLDGGKPLRFLGPVHIKNQEYLDAENLLVPLANDEGQPTFVMGLCRYKRRVDKNEDDWIQIPTSHGSIFAPRRLSQLVV